MSKFKKGDFVEITNNGYTYTTFTTKFEELGFGNTKENDCFEKGTIAQVFDVSEDGIGREIVAICDQKGCESLIGVEGVKKVDFISNRVKPMKVTLTSDYDAVVYNDRIQVGCQIISKEAFEILVHTAKLTKLIK